MIDFMSSVVAGGAAYKAHEEQKSYKGALSHAMFTLAQDPLFRAVGYGLLDGKGMNGTAKEVPNCKIVETTVAENLMMSMAQGMAMNGLRPLIYLERGDFVFCCMSALCSHLDKCKEISRGEWNPCVLIRIHVGKKTKPLFTGPTHTTDVYETLKAALRMPVYRLRTPDEVTAAYERATREQREGITSSVLIDYGDLF